MAAGSESRPSAGKLPYRSWRSEYLSMVCRYLTYSRWILCGLHNCTKDSWNFPEKNHDGEILDFHSLRHICGAWLAMRGAHPKAVQAVMRHPTITLTMDTYGHLFPGQEADTVARLPKMLDDGPRALRATGAADHRAEGAQRHAQQSEHGSIRACAKDVEGQAKVAGGADGRNPLSGNEKRNAPRSDAKRCDPAPPGIRTPDPLIKSQLLCQLS